MRMLQWLFRPSHSQRRSTLSVPNSAIDMVVRGVEFRRQGAISWPEAESLFQQAIKLSPDYAEAHYQLASIWVGALRNRHNVPGWSFLAERSRREIVDILGRVMALDPDHPGPHYSLACLACYPPQSFSTVKREYAKALALDSKCDPQYFIYHLDVAMEASQHKDKRLAVEAFKRCFELDPEYIRARPAIEPAATFNQIALDELRNRTR